MKNRLSVLTVIAALVVLFGASAVRAQDAAAAQKTPKSPSTAVLENWNDVGGRIVTMAEDWPEDKYNFRPNAQVRTFADVLRHIAGSNFGLLNQVTGKKIGDGANDPSPETYKTKAQIVAFVKKSVEDGAATIKEQGDAGILKTLDYWIGYTEHMGEHYGQLVQYYRDNNVVPPESRPKK
jgi:DinB superfamily